MKKYLLLFIPFLLTGCFGSMDGTLVKTCIKEEYSANIVETKKYEVEFKKNNISKIIFTDSYSGDIDMSNAINSYKKAYQNEEGITITSDDSSIKYVFEMDKISDKVKKDFNLTNKYNDLQKKFKESGIVCN